MKYPMEMTKGSTVGITAVSSGLGNRIEEYEGSLDNINEYYNIVETNNVRNEGFASSSAEVRGEQLNSLFIDRNIDGIFCAAGGGFCLETLDYIDYDAIKNNPKWILGASDPTSILYSITTKLDIATMYGFNAVSFSGNMHECHKNCLEILQGNLVKQNSYKKYDVSKGHAEYILDGDVYWESSEDIDCTGRIIGGCFDVLLCLLGTKYDYTKQFLDKYEKDGIIWYFDVFAKSADDFYLGLLQMKMAGWFRNVKCIVVGRVKYPSSFTEEFDYITALERLNLGIPYIFNSDIGHVFPKMTIINGSIATVKCSNGKGSIEMELK